MKDLQRQNSSRQFLFRKIDHFDDIPRLLLRNDPPPGRRPDQFNPVMPWHTERQRTNSGGAQTLSESSPLIGQISFENGDAFVKSSRDLLAVILRCDQLKLKHKRQTWSWYYFHLMAQTSFLLDRHPN
jgi:hypothetical protein